jgi:hypothetical protein
VLAACTAPVTELKPSTEAIADILPEPAKLALALGVSPQKVRVHEPHLFIGDARPLEEYSAFRSEDVLNEMLGKDWVKSNDEIELRALDGYFVRVPVAKLKRYRAYFAIGRADGSAFTVDNPAQQEKNLPLGPYYLIWDNVSHPELMRDGATHWPYQISSVALRAPALQSLLPAGMPPKYRPQAELAQKYCLSCHLVNGYGGDKMPINLADRVKRLNQSEFLAWVLEPTAIDSYTAMPALAPMLPQAERERIAHDLYDYFLQLPVHQ